MIGALHVAGAAMGAAVAAMVPGVDIGIAAAEDVAGCCTVGMNRPVVVLLVLMSMASTLALLPLTIGVMMGWLVTQALPAERPH